jgi:hypothetical protein
MDGKCIRLDLEEADYTEKYLVQVEDLPGSFQIRDDGERITVLRADDDSLPFKARMGSSPDAELMTTIFRCADHAYVVESDGAKFID